MATLLTGASGFLGIHVLKEFLREKRSVVVVLRPRPGPPMLDRLDGLLTLAGATDEVREQLRTTVRCVPGDLQADGLGIPDADRRRLREEITELWHCAASITLRKQSPVPWDVNVTGTKRILDFIDVLPQSIRFFPVSTVYVAGVKRAGRFGEQLPAGTTAFENNYERSKHAAEEMLADWSERTGRSCTVFRTSVLINDRSIVSDFPGHELLAMARLLSALLRAVPDGETARLRWPADPLATLNIVPVDYTVHAMVRMTAGQRATAPAQAIHITNPVDTPIPTMRRALEETCNVRIRAVPDYPSDPTRAERQLYRTISAFFPYFNQRRTYSSERLHNAKLTLPSCPVVDEAFMLRSLSAVRRERRQSYQSEAALR